MSHRQVVYLFPVLGEEGFVGGELRQEGRLLRSKGRWVRVLEVRRGFKEREDEDIGLSMIQNFEVETYVVEGVPDDVVGVLLGREE